MVINLNEQILKTNDSNLAELLQLIILQSNCNMEDAINSLIAKGYITKNRDPNIQKDWIVTRGGNEFLTSMIIASDKKLPKDDSLVQLATDLKEIFPKGKKEGTNLYWAEGIQLIIRRLKIFFKKYGEFPHEDIVNAAKKYINNYNSYQYMQVLKYFIFKEKIGAAGEVEGESQLLNYMENSDNTDNLREDWTSNVL